MADRDLIRIDAIAHDRRTAAVAGMLVLAMVLGGCQRSAPTPPAEVPTPAPIIIVDIDTLRANHLGCYGYARDTSPNLDAFATEAVQFRSAFSQAPNTPPSQTSILTGLYPMTHGMIGDEDRVPDEIVTMAEALRDHGYVTAGFHDGGYLSNHFNMGQGFGLYDGNGGKGLEQIGPKAIGWLREHAAEPSFLLFIHTYDTHTPYAPVPPFDELFTAGLAPPSPGFIPNPEQMEAVRLSKYTDNPRKLPDNDLAWAMAMYDGEIRYVDTWFGDFMQVVRELGLDRRAIIVVISDHGEEFQEHGSVLHEKLYATVTHIPLLIRLPGGVNPRQVAAIAEGVDLMPTLLELTGTPIPPAVQGASLVPLMTATGPRGGEIAFGESPFFGRRRFAAAGHYRLLLTRSSGAVELYDYGFDPMEQNEISALYPEVAATLERAIDEWEAHATAAQVEPGAQGDQVDSETLRQLKELGYIQ